MINRKFVIVIQKPENMKNVKIAKQENEKLVKQNKQKTAESIIE